MAGRPKKNNCGLGEEVVETILDFVGRGRDEIAELIDEKIIEDREYLAYYLNMFENNEYVYDLLKRQFLMWKELDKSMKKATFAAAWDLLEYDKNNNQVKD